MSSYLLNIRGSYEVIVRILTCLVSFCEWIAYQGLEEIAKRQDLLSSTKEKVLWRALIAKKTEYFGKHYR